MTGMDGAQYKLSCRFEQMSLYTYLFALNLLYSCGIPCFGLDKQSIALGYYFDQMINYNRTYAKRILIEGERSS
jgi:hypothetical protein